MLILVTFLDSNNIVFRRFVDQNLEGNWMYARQNKINMKYLVPSPSINSKDKQNDKQRKRHTANVC